MLTPIKSRADNVTPMREYRLLDHDTMVSAVKHAYATPATRPLLARPPIIALYKIDAIGLKLD